MGTMLQKGGLQPGHCPEALCLTDPDCVAAIHRAYIGAGSRIAYANTFGANRDKLAETGYSVAQLIPAAVACARAACAGTDARVALDVGPVGQLLEPYGTLPFEEAYDIYREVMEAGAADDSHGIGTDCEDILR